jgi:hypothetical protein
MSYKSSLRDFTGVRQFPQELHFGSDCAERVGVEGEDAQRVVRQFFIDHFEVEIDIGGKTTRILCGHDRATRALEKTAIPFVLHVREAHETEKSTSLLCGHRYCSADPVGEGDSAAGLNDAHRFRNQPILVEDVTPSVLAPDEVCGAVR